MKIQAIHNERNLTELARRLFKIEGPHAAAEERKAIAALRSANPHLRTGASLPEGAPVVVPDLEELRHAPDAGRVAGLSNDAARELRAALSRAGGVLEAAHAEERREQEAEAADLKRYGREIKEGGREVAERFAAVQQAAKRRARELAERRKLDQQALARLEKDLEVLLKALR